MCIHCSVEMTYKNGRTLACMSGLCVLNISLPEVVLFPTASQLPPSQHNLPSYPGAQGLHKQGDTEQPGRQRPWELVGTAVQMRKVLCIWRMTLFGWSGGV